MRSCGRMLIFLAVVFMLQRLEFFNSVWTSVQVAARDRSPYRPAISAISGSGIGSRVTIAALPINGVPSPNAEESADCGRTQMAQ